MIASIQWLFSNMFLLCITSNWTRHCFSFIFVYHQQTGGSMLLHISTATLFTSRLLTDLTSGLDSAMDIFDVISISILTYNVHCECTWAHGDWRPTAGISRPAPFFKLKVTFAAWLSSRGRDRQPAHLRTLWPDRSRREGPYKSANGALTLWWIIYTTKERHHRFVWLLFYFILYYF